MNIKAITSLNQGDLCPKCGLIICMPPNLMANCLGCGYDLSND